MDQAIVRNIIEGIGFLTSIGGIFVLIYKFGRFVEKFANFQNYIIKEFSEVKVEIKDVSRKIDDIRDRVSRVEGQEDFSRSVILEMVKKK